MLRCLTSLIFSNKPVSGCVISPPSTAQPACFQWKINDSHCWFCLFFLVHWNSFNRQLLCGPAPFILCKPSPTLAPYQGHTLQFSSSCWTALKFASVGSTSSPTWADPPLDLQALRPPLEPLSRVYRWLRLFRWSMKCLPLLPLKGPC